MATRKTKAKKQRKLMSARARAEKRAQMESGNSCIVLPKGKEFFEIKKAGKVYIDIIPYEAKETTDFVEAGDLAYERTYHMHRDVGPNKEKVICPSTHKQPCPICEFRNTLDWDDEEEQAIMKQLRHKERQLFNVVDTRNREKGVQVLDISYHCFGKLLDERIRNMDEDDDWDTFADLEEGLTLAVTFSEEKMGKNTFYEAIAIDFKRRKVQYDDELLDEAVCLDDLVKARTYEELEELAALDDDGSGKTTTKKTKAAGGKKKKKPAPADDEEEDDEEEADDADDEELDDEEEADDDEEDDDEEEAEDDDADDEEEADDDDDEDWDDDDEEEADDDEEEADDEEEEDPEDDDDDWDDDDDEEEEEPELDPKPSRKKRPAKKAAKKAVKKTAKKRTRRK